MLAIKNTLKTVGKIIDSLQELSEEQRTLIGSDIQGKVKKITVTPVLITSSQTLTCVHWTSVSSATMIIQTSIILTPRESKHFDSDHASMDVLISNLGYMNSGLSKCFFLAPSSLDN